MINTFKSILLFLIFIAFCFSACDNIENKAKNTVSHTGQTLGKGTTEFVKGIKEGVDKTLQCKLNVSSSLSDKGIQTGKFFISHSEGATDNVLTVYFIFNKNYTGKVSAKVFDKSGQEYGRTNVHIEGREGEAKYADFVFDKRTEIESKSAFSIE